MYETRVIMALNTDKRWHNNITTRIQGMARKGCVP